MRFRSANRARKPQTKENGSFMPARFIQLISIPVSDQQAAKAFYTEKLGFSVQRDDPFQDDARWIQLGVEGGQTGITLVTWFSQMPAGSAQGLVLNVDDVSSMHGDLQAQGVDVSEIESAPWGTFFTLSDPDGNGWVIQQDPQG
jgi:catechol 2,3-dioxygenase-like lactoylglutathione lyase family enzyme